MSKYTSSNKRLRRLLIARHGVIVTYDDEVLLKLASEVGKKRNLPAAELIRMYRHYRERIVRFCVVNENLSSCEIKKRCILESISYNLVLTHLVEKKRSS